MLLKRIILFAIVTSLSFCLQGQKIDCFYLPIYDLVKPAIIAKHCYLGDTTTMILKSPLVELTSVECDNGTINYWTSDRWVYYRYIPDHLGKVVFKYSGITYDNKKVKGKQVFTVIEKPDIKIVVIEDSLLSSTKRHIYLELHDKKTASKLPDNFFTAPNGIYEAYDNLGNVLGTISIGKLAKDNMSRPLQAGDIVKFDLTVIDNKTGLYFDLKNISHVVGTRDN